MSHLKSYAAPKSWTLLRKENKFVTCPKPGAHPLVYSIPIALLLKQTGDAKTTKEVKYIINEKAVIVDGKEIKDHRFPTGFMDSIHIKPKTFLRCTLDEKGRLKFITVPETELKKKLSKITGKTTVRKGKTQYNLSDGRNIISDKKYAVGDSLLIETPSQKVIDHYPLTEGNLAFMLSGRHTATTGTIDKIEGDRIWFTSGKEKFETLKKFAFIIGKDKPAVKL